MIAPVPAPSPAKKAKAPSDGASDRRILLFIAGGLILVALPLIALGSAPVKIFAALVALAALQGLWRGAAEITGVVVGMILAMLIAPTVGPAMEGLIGGIAGTQGITNRVVSIAVIGLILVVAGWAGGAFAGRALMKNRPEWKVWDKYAGAGIGGLEGVLLGLVILWAPLAMEPIAKARVEDDAAIGAPPSPAAEWAVSMAQSVRESALGGVAEATNPLPESELLTLMSDFSAVSRDREAMEWLLTSPVMMRLQEMPSIEDALNRVRNAPELVSMLGDDGLEPGDIVAFLNSPVSIEILDETTVVRDVAPLADELKSTIREARSRVKGGTGPGPG